MMMCCGQNYLAGVSHCTLSGEGVWFNDHIMVMQKMALLSDFRGEPERLVFGAISCGSDSE